MGEARTRDLKATWLATKAAGRFSTRLAGRFASRLWFTPWPVPLGDGARAKQAAWLATTEPITFDVGTHRVAGFTAGTGPTVLLVHGWGETAATLGGFIEPLVRTGHRVVGIDLPGHGKTSYGRTNIFEQTHAIRAVAEQVGGLDAIVAHSMGGYVTSVAIGEGLGAGAIVLIAPASDVDHVMGKFQTLFALPPRAMAGLRADIERRFGGDVWERLNIRSHATRFSAPALIVHDRDDDQIDVTESEALARAWPRARTLYTSGLGHDKPTRDPNVIAGATDFLVEMLRPVEVGLVTADF